jgi:hypothetical protein
MRRILRRCDAPSPAAVQRRIVAAAATCPCTSDATGARHTDDTGKLHVIRARHTDAAAATCPCSMACIGGEARAREEARRGPARETLRIRRGASLIYRAAPPAWHSPPRRAGGDAECMLWRGAAGLYEGPGLPGRRTRCTCGRRTRVMHVERPTRMPPGRPRIRGAGKPRIRGAGQPRMASGPVP